MRNGHRAIVALAFLALASACSDDGADSPAAPPAGAIATSLVATGDITAKVNEYRALLGEPRNGGAVGPQAAGRREIGWDGVPPQFDNGDNLFPPDFFNTTVKLGAIFATAGSGFRNDSTLFDGVNPAYAAQFKAFSPNKIFAAVGSNVLDMTFRVAGTTTPAVVNGLGVVFTDVDTPGATSLDYYAADGRLLGHFAAPTRSDATGLSFVGVKYDSPVVARVRFTLGQGALGAGVNDISAGGTVDLVAVDDLIYGEPQP
jgi:hypothetical protein